MHRPVFVIAFIVVLASQLAAGVFAQERPAANATPGAVGVSGVPLGAIDPVAAQGYRLQVVELTWEPGAYTTRHFHPTALITCVQQGSLGFVLQHGAATLTRGGTADAPGEAEPLALDTEVTLQPRDCIAFDEFADHMEHTGWNAGNDTLILWEARLFDPDQPFTTYVNDAGTPVP
jgi:predicted metal-dependent enzyme (double-stranded beta helix superfamily)